MFGSRKRPFHLLMNFSGYLILTLADKYCQQKEQKSVISSTGSLDEEKKAV
jgi:hypothetical protein